MQQEQEPEREKRKGLKERTEKRTRRAIPTATPDVQDRSQIRVIQETHGKYIRRNSGDLAGVVTVSMEK